MFTRIERPYGVRRWLALAGAAYGLFHFAVQGKGWEYHFYPLAVFLCALASAPLAAQVKTSWRASPALALSRAPALAMLGVAGVRLGVKGVAASVLRG